MLGVPLDLREPNPPTVFFIDGKDHQRDQGWLGHAARHVHKTSGEDWSEIH